MAADTAIVATTGEVLAAHELAARLDEAMGEAARLREKIQEQEHALQIELDEKRRLDGMLRAATSERNRKREHDPFWTDAVEVFNYWRRKLRAAGRDAREFGKSRWEPTRARLGAGYTVDELKLAIDGAFELPETMSAGQRATMQDLKWIMHEAPRVDRFIADAKRAAADRQPAAPANGNGTGPVDRHEAQPARDEPSFFMSPMETLTPLDRACWAVGMEFGRSAVEWSRDDDDRIVGAFAVCPLEPGVRQGDDHARTLYLHRGRDPRGRLALTCSHGHDPVELLAGIRELELKFDGHWRAAHDRATVALERWRADQAAAGS